MRYLLVGFTAVVFVACKSREEKQLDAKADSLYRVADTLDAKAESIRQETDLFKVTMDSLFDSARALQRKADGVGKAGDPERARMWLDSAEALKAKAQALLMQK